MGKVTIKDIAKICNVSTATISRVMSNSDKVNFKTSEKVKKVIKELGYTPNSLAQNLTKQSTNIIGVCIQSNNKEILNNSFFIQMITYLSKEFSKCGYYLLYIFSNNSKDEYDKITNMIKSKRIDGLIFLTLKNSNDLISYLKSNKFPFVVVGTPIDKKNVLFVDNDNIETTYKITKKLLKENKDILFVCGSKELEVTKYRLLGYKKALLEKKIEFDENKVIECEFDENDSYQKIIKYSKNIDAVVTTDDILAIGCMKYFNEINKNIEVVGFNNIQLRKYLPYKFSTVDIQVEKLAISATKLLISSINKIYLENNYSIIKTKYINRDE